MQRDLDFPAVADDEPTAPLNRITHDGFRRATGEELRTPVHAELLERLKRGLASLDNDFPGWLVEVFTETDDGLVLRFQDVEAVRNVAAKLRDRGLMTPYRAGGGSS